MVIIYNVGMYILSLEALGSHLVARVCTHQVLSAPMN